MSDFRTGNGLDWLDFLVTMLGRRRPEQRELLGDVDDLGDWLAQHRLTPVSPVTGPDLEAARGLRECLHRLAASAVQGRPPAPSDVRRLNDALASEAALHVRRSEDSLTMSPPADVTAALARLAHQAAVDLTGPNRELLRFCGDDACSGIFLDLTGRRRWCSDERCGVRFRVRAHRARARTPADPDARAPTLSTLTSQEAR